jgi:hypothetical protein
VSNVAGFLLSLWAIRPLSAVLACGDRYGVVAAGAGVRVVGEDGTRAVQLADQAGGVSRGSDVYRAGLVHRAAVGEEDGQSGQVRQDLVFTGVGVSRLSGAGRCRAGVAAAAPVGGLAVGPC